MDNESGFANAWQKISEKLNEQVWFQQLRAKWEELDVQSRTYLKYAAGGVSGLLVLIIIFSAMAGARSARNELEERTRLLNLVRNANEQMRDMQATGAPRGGAPTGPWPGYFNQLASSAGISQESVAISPEKKVAGGESAEEAIYELSVQRINVRQLVRYAFQLENGARPVQIRHVAVDTRGENTGYLDAKIEVSAYEPKAE